jgi:DNA transposition AAA+ family ATPase
MPKKVVPFKMEKVYEDPKVEKVRHLLDKVLEQSDFSINQLAKMLDVGRSTLTEFQNGSYPYPAKLAKELKPQLEAAARRLADKAAEAEVPVVEGGIFETRAFKRARQVLEACRRRGELGIITGHAGVGKTTALKAYAANHSDTILITANPTYGKIGALRSLSAILGLDPFRHCQYLLDEIADELKAGPRLLIVDEADLLSYPGLEILRTIHDKCEPVLGVVLSGLPRLYRNMTTGRRGGNDYSQLYSRVAVYAELPMPSCKEVLAFVKSRCEEKVPKEVVDVLYQEAAMHGMRRLVKLLPGAVEIARRNDESLSVEAVEAARDAYMMVS